MKTFLRYSVFAVIFAAPLTTYPCTTFCIRDSKHLVFGKNFDFHTGVGHVVVNKRNIRKLSYTIPAEKQLEWISKYGSITFNQMGKEFPYGGINEKGLVIELMWLDDTTYPELDNRAGLAELQWIQYQLDNAATIEEVIASDKVVRISKISTAPLHFLVCDAMGNVATIEYIGGRMVVHTKSSLSVCVLTNDTYDKSRNYTNSLGELKTRTFTKGSYDRFAKAASMVNEFKGSDAIHYSFSILDGVAQGNFTRWSIVYDIRNMTIYYKTQNNPEVRVLKVGDFDFSCDKASLFIDIDENVDKGARTFRPYSYEKNLELITKAFSQVDFLQSTPREEIELNARYPEGMMCGK